MAQERQAHAVRRAVPFPPPNWKFSPWQKRVWRRTAKTALPGTIWMVAGRGAGKDILAIRCAIRDALKLYAKRKKEGTGEKVLNPLVRVLVIAPSEHALKQTRRDLLGELRALEESWGVKPSTLAKHHVRDCVISLFGRGNIEFEYQVTSREDSLRGPGCDVAIYTEIGTETRPAAYREELSAQLTRAGRNGRAYIYGSPKGPSGLLWDELVSLFGGKEVGEEKLTSITNDMWESEDGLTIYVHADAFQNVFLSEEQIAKIRAEERHGASYEQERLARFVITDVGADPVYERDWVEKCLTIKRQEKPGRSGVLIGVDLARKGRDWTVFHIVDRESGETLRIESYKVTLGPDIVDHMKRLAQEYGPGETLFLMDTTAHQAFVADFLPRWIRVETMKIYDKDKERLVYNLRFLLQVARVRIPDSESQATPFASAKERETFREWRRQMLQFQRVVQSNGGVRFEAPSGGHDDHVTAHYLAVDPIAREMRGKFDSEKAKGKARELFE